LGTSAIRDDVGTDVAGHHDSDPYLRRVGPPVFDHRFGKAVHGKLRRRIRGVGHAGSPGCPEAVNAAGVHEHAVPAGDEQRQERASHVVHAPPVDCERALPGLSCVADEAGTSADAGVAEHQVDVTSGVLLEQFVAQVYIIMISDCEEAVSL
jgi:hypothetical protein